MMDILPLQMSPGAVRPDVLTVGLLLVLLASACGTTERRGAGDASTSAGSTSAGSASAFTGAEGEVGLMILNPGHFHAGLVQKYDVPQLAQDVHVYAPEGQELENYLDLVEGFNTREENPTDWNQQVYTGQDYLEKMLQEKPGNVMVVAGDNARKIEYVRRAVANGINVLADKPIIIDPADFPALKEVLETTDQKGLLANDIMTERYVAATRLQRELSRIPEFFGELRPGTPEEPAITKESVHHYYKNVAGETLIRPAWFFDAKQQGEPIVGVSTHLVDLILWEAFPGEPIDYREQGDAVEVLSARSWENTLTPSEFAQVTGQRTYPDYLRSNVDADSVLHVAGNGEFVFKARGVHGKVSVRWDYENPGGGDTHYSIMRGTRANLVVRKQEQQNFETALYVEPVGEDDDQFQSRLQQALKRLEGQYEGLRAEPSELGWRVVIPQEYKEGHEEHFARVVEQYLDYLVEGRLPAWERANLLTKYYVTTKAYEMSR